MKQLTILYLSACLCLLAVISCKKDPVPENSASLTVINALPGCPIMVADFTGKTVAQFSDNGVRLSYGSYAPSYNFSVPAKEQSLALSKFPFVVQDQPVYRLTLNPSAGDISTLFLMGTLAQPEQLLITAKPPYYSVKDSLVGLRFVNLSAGSSPVNVKISGSGLSTVINSNGLAYKGITAYLPVSAISKIGDLLVQFYDQASGNLLCTYMLPGVGATLTDNPWRYRNYTLALIGLPNAANPVDAQKIMQINDY